MIMHRTIHIYIYICCLDVRRIESYIFSRVADKRNLGIAIRIFKYGDNLNFFFSNIIVVTRTMSFLPSTLSVIAFQFSADSSNEFLRFELCEEHCLAVSQIWARRFRFHQLVRSEACRSRRGEEFWGNNRWFLCYHNPYILWKSRLEHHSWRLPGWRLPSHSRPKAIFSM